MFIALAPSIVLALQRSAMCSLTLDLAPLERLPNNRLQVYKHTAPPSKSRRVNLSLPLKRFLNFKRTVTPG